MDNDFLTTSEVAEKLGVTRWRINALIRDGRLEAKRFGGIWLVREKDLAAVMVRKNGRPKKADAPQAEKPEPKTGYSVRDAAEKLGVSRSTMAAKIRDGRLASEKVGRSRRITDDELKRAAK